jgi:hypothetical protein
MSAKQGDYYTPGINMYVPAMQYASDHQFGPIVEISLGTPSAADADGVHADLDADAAITVVGTTGVINRSDLVPGTGGIGGDADANFGRCVSMTVSADPGATGFSVRIEGEDYLGQPMRENLTAANTVTAAQITKKAFKRINRLVPLVAATNAITADVGWADRFGVPWKVGQFLGGVEGGVDALAGQGFWTDLVALTALEDVKIATFEAPFDGFITGVNWEVTTAVATAGTLFDFTLNGTGNAALDFTIPIAAAGHSGGLLLDPTAWQAVTRGDAVLWTSDGVPSAGAAEIQAIFAEGVVPVMVGPSLVDPAIVSSLDPRGIYIPVIAPNAAREYKVRYMPSNDVNSDGNGGLHGIRHFNA